MQFCCSASYYFANKRGSMVYLSSLDDLITLKSHSQLIAACFYYIISLANWFQSSNGTEFWVINFLRYVVSVKDVFCHPPFSRTNECAKRKRLLKAP